MFLPYISLVTFMGPSSSQVVCPSANSGRRLRLRSPEHDEPGTQIARYILEMLILDSLTIESLYNRNGNVLYLPTHLASYLLTQLQQLNTDGYLLRNCCKYTILSGSHFPHNPNLI